MTIAIGPKNEASTLKSLKLAKIKDFYKMMSFRSTLMGYLVSGHIFDGTLPFSCKKFKKKFWPVQLLENAPQVEAKSYHTTVTYKEFCNLTLQTNESGDQYGKSAYI